METTETVTVWLLTSYRSDKKRTEFICKIQAIVDNDLSKLFSSITRDMGLSEFLIWHKDIHYFSYKMRKSKFLSEAMKDKAKDRTAKFLKRPMHPSDRTGFDFTQMWKLPSRLGQ